MNYWYNSVPCEKVEKLKIAAFQIQIKLKNLFFKVTVPYIFCKYLRIDLF